MDFQLFKNYEGEIELKYLPFLLWMLSLDTRIPGCSSTRASETYQTLALARALNQYYYQWSAGADLWRGTTPSSLSIICGIWRV